MTLTDLGRVHRTGLRRRRTVALDGVTVAFERGSTTGVFGPNGSGKSTLLRILAGVERPTAGGVTVLGGDPRDVRVRRRLAYLPDGNPLPSELTGSAALGLVARLAGLDRRAARYGAAAMLERVGLGSAARASLGTYSRGMLRRFGFAQAFIAEPELLLLDEPTAGLDAPGFPLFAELLAEARDRGATVVLASHLAPDLLEGCDALALLVDGRLVGHGPPEEIAGDPGALELTVRSAAIAADPAAAAAGVREALEGRGHRVERVGPGRRSLLDLYEGERGDR